MEVIFSGLYQGDLFEEEPSQEIKKNLTALKAELDQGTYCTSLLSLTLRHGN